MADWIRSAISSAALRRLQRNMPGGCSSGTQWEDDLNINITIGLIFVQSYCSRWTLCPILARYHMHSLEATKQTHTKHGRMLRRVTTQFARAARAHAQPIAPAGSRFVHINGNQIRTGMALDIDGKIFRVTKSQHVKPGKGGAYVQCDLKEIKTGSKTNRRFRAAESVAKAALGPDEWFQFLYREGDKLLLMHNTSFEQMEVDKELFSDRQLEFLVEGTTLSLQIVDGDVLWANMPEYMTLEVVETTAKGVADSALSVKDAKLSNGAVVKVPLYIEVGHQVRISTEDGAFVDKA